jgi:hypothetical protein
MQGPPPPLPNLEPPAEIRPAEPDVLHRLHHSELEQAADVAHKFYELEDALVEDKQRRDQEKAQDHAVTWSPGKADQQDRDARETRRRSRAERNR